MQPNSRIKRKPVPSIDYRYPAPDPTDPFAPLWLLRSRPSNPGISLNTSYHLYPTIVGGPLVDEPSQYRRRSQSTPPTHLPSQPFHVSRKQPNDTASADLESIGNPLSKNIAVAVDPLANSSNSSLSSFVHVSPDVVQTVPVHVHRNRSAIPSSVSTPLPISNFNLVHLHPHKRSLSLTSPRSLPEPEWSLPSPSRLARAAALPVIAPSGLRVPFGSLFATHPTIVLFIRHFWCPLCQDYMSSVADVLGGQTTIIAESSTASKKSEQVNLVVISNGSPSFIPKYKQLFHVSCKMYTDPSLAVYDALGMGRDTIPTASTHHPCTTTQCNPGDMSPRRQHYRETSRDGTYVRHGLVSGIAMVVLRALKLGMPVWERGGDVHQLGGEFVLGPGLKCTYAHRMQSTKGHAPIQDVLAAARVHVLPLSSPLPRITELKSSTPPSSPFRNIKKSTPLTSPHRSTFRLQRRTSSVCAPIDLSPSSGPGGANINVQINAMKDSIAWHRRFSVDGTSLYVHPMGTPMVHTRTLGTRQPASGPVLPGSSSSSRYGGTSSEQEMATVTWKHDRVALQERQHERRGGGGTSGTHPIGSTQRDATIRRTRSENSHCSPTTSPTDVDVNKVMLIGFANEAPKVDDEEVSPTGATEGQNE